MESKFININKFCYELCKTGDVEFINKVIGILKDIPTIIDIPSSISVHLSRHIYAQPYVSGLRNDRYNKMEKKI